MLIDTHTHIYPDKIVDKAIHVMETNSGLKVRCKGTYDALLEMMQQQNVNYSVVLPVVTNPVHTDSINRNAIEINDRFEETGILSFGGIHPESGADSSYKKILNQLSEHGVKGIKLHPDYQATFIDDITCLRIIDYASSLGMIVTIHAGIDVGLPDIVHCPPQRTVNVLKQVEPYALVLAHMGGWTQWDEVEQLIFPYCNEHVFLDTAVSIGHMAEHKLLGEEQFVRMVRAIGSKQVLFGTDSPWEMPQTMEQVVLSMPLTDSEKQDILYQNALKLLKLPQ